MKSLTTACLLAALALGAAAFAAEPIAPLAVDVPAGAYKLDKAHASLIFRVSHLGFSNYTARFGTFDADLQLDPKAPELASLTAKVDPNSLELENPPDGFLDELRGPQFLDTAKYPEITFKSTAVELTAPNTARVTGDFSLHGATHPLVLEVTFNGGYAGHPMDPAARIGFSAHGQIKRSDYGISLGIPEPGTTMGVGDAVDIIIEAEFSGPPLKDATPH